MSAIKLSSSRHSASVTRTYQAQHSYRQEPIRHNTATDRNLSDTTQLQCTCHSATFGQSCNTRTTSTVTIDVDAPTAAARAIFIVNKEQLDSTMNIPWRGGEMDAWSRLHRACRAPRHAPGTDVKRNNSWELTTDTPRWTRNKQTNCKHSNNTMHATHHRHCQSQEASILWSHDEDTKELPRERDNARNNVRCTQARKTTMDNISTWTDSPWKSQSEWQRT